MYAPTRVIGMASGLPFILLRGPEREEGVFEVYEPGVDLSILNGDDTSVQDTELIYMVVHAGAAHEHQGEDAGLFIIWKLPAIV